MASRIAEAGYVVQKRTRLNGQWYEPGDPAPDTLTNPSRLVTIGILAPAPAGVVQAMPRVADGYSPEGGTVDEVLRFVANHPEQRERVLEAEQGGQGRVTLVEALEAEDLPDVGLSAPARPPEAPRFTPTSALPAFREEAGSVEAGVSVPEGPEDLDPAEHSVAVVVGWVDSRPDQAENILSAERDGRNRSTLVAHLERVIQERTSPTE